MEPAIPDGIGEIDDDWLSLAMGSPVRVAGIEDIGTGVGMIGALYRATLEGDGPGSVVVKLPGLDETARFTAAILRLNIREVGFYRELAAESPIRVPSCHFGAVDADTHQFVLVLEDVGSCRAVDQIEGMGHADAEQAVDELARWHAHWVGRGRPDRGAGNRGGHQRSHLPDAAAPGVLRRLGQGPQRHERPPAGRDGGRRLG